MPRTIRGVPETAPGVSVLPWVRLAGIPLFVITVVGFDSVWAGLAVLALMGVLDRSVERGPLSSDRVTTRTALASALTDRLLVVTLLLVLAAGGHAPWWVAAAVICRDLLLVALVPLLRSRGRDQLPAHFVGRTATIVLLYTAPLLLLTDQSGVLGALASVLGWAATLWGVGLYWWSGAIYVWQLQSFVQQVPPQVSRRTTRKARA